MSRGEGHSSSLVYTNNDDGIWLCCTCGFQQGLGYSPMVSIALETWRAHLREVDRVRT